VTSDHDPEQAAGALAVYRRSANPIYTRTHGEISAMLDGLGLVPPGLVDATQWHHDHTPELTQRTEHVGFYAAVAERA
jgi:hypothetical protein